MLKLGLDVHLEFIMAVAQKDHANPHTPRKFTREQLLAQVKKRVAEGAARILERESVQRESRRGIFQRRGNDFPLSLEESSPVGYCTTANPS